MATKSKNQRKRVKLYLMAVTSCVVLAGVWAALATPETALAKKPSGGGDGGGKNEAVCFKFLGGGIESDAGDYCNNVGPVEALMDKYGHVMLRTNADKDPDTGHTGKSNRKFFCNTCIFLLICEKKCGILCSSRFLGMLCTFHSPVIHGKCAIMRGGFNGETLRLRR